MRSTLVGLALVAITLLLVMAFGQNVPVAAQRPQGNVSPGERSSATEVDLQTHSLELADGRQQIVVIDSRTRAMAIYQVDPRNGAISLKSARNIAWDLQMDEFNAGDKPSPKDIRALLEQRLK
jgi:hypothetical protein